MLVFFFSLSAYDPPHLESSVFRFGKFPAALRNMELLAPAQGWFSEGAYLCNRPYLCICLLSLGCIGRWSTQGAYLVFVRVCVYLSAEYRVYWCIDLILNSSWFVFFCQCSLHLSSSQTEANFERPLVTLQSEASLRELLAHQGEKNIWFAGSYATPGCVPLLEGGVLSAATVTRQLGVSLPWRADYSSISEHSRSLVATTSDCTAYSTSTTCSLGSIIFAVVVTVPLLLPHWWCHFK
jgi:hypothetical protein